MVGLYGSVAGVVLVIICSLAKYIQRRRVARLRGAQLIRRPILLVDLAEPLDLPHFPPPIPIELADLDIRYFAAPPPSPILLNRRQFPAPGSPNQQLLSPRQRQSAQRRLPYEYSLPPSLPATPVLPFPATPPRSPVPDLALSRDRLNSPVRVHNPVHAENAAQFNTDFTARLLAGPPRSPLSRTTQAAPESSIISTSRNTTAPALLQSLTRKELVLPVELPSSLRTIPQLQIIPSAEPIASPESSASSLLPSPILADPVTSHSTSPPPQRRAVRRFPSFPATPLSPVPESGVTACSSRKTRNPKKMKRHSMVFGASTSQSGSPVPQVCVPSSRSPTLPCTTPPSEKEPPNVSDGRPESAVDGEIAERLPLADVHNTTPIRTEMRRVIEIPVLASQLGLPPGKHLTALISPVKVLRQIDRGPDPVYQYHPEAPAVAVRKSIVRPAQDDFKNFSAALDVKFGQKGWAPTGPNELAPAPAKKSKKKKKKAITKGPSVPPSPIPNLLSTFKPTDCTNSLSTRPEPSAERIVSTGCHPNCADIYCPGGCSEVQV
ncbi:hypothetical protein B0H19DRAFT_1114572 [Mycena capillaripes]|nr:hypothetical protein B0H19DRAFT_1114572 [Mycena capillaripes]